MKSRSACLLVLSVAGAFALTLFPPPSSGQADDPVPPLIEEVIVQQGKIVENQKAMDEKIAAIGEAVRQARIFASRGGK